MNRNMASYPNRDALRDAHDIYLNAMQPFIIRCLKKIQGQTLEDLIRDVIDYEPSDNIETAIEIGNIPHLLKNYWRHIFATEFNGNRNIENTAWLIVESRNRASHPPWDLDIEFTRAHLFLIANLLEKINRSDAKREVENIRDQLCSDEVEEHPAEVENADLKERFADMSEQLAAVKAEKTECEKRLQDVQKRLEDLEEIEAAWMDSEERLTNASNELKKAKAKRRECEKNRKAIASELEAAKAEKGELEEYLAEIEEYFSEMEAADTEYEEDSSEIVDVLPNTNTPDSITFQGTTFTKYLNMYRAAGDGITQTFWHYWHAQGREGKEEMRDAGWSVEKVEGDWKITISPEDFQAWIENEAAELSNLFNPSPNEERPPQPVRPVHERTTLPTSKEMEQPALEPLADRSEHRRVEIINHLTEYFSLTDNARSYLSKTGQAEKHLMNKGLIERTRTGYYRITTRGLQVLRRSSDDVPF